MLVGAVMIVVSVALVVGLESRRSGRRKPVQPVPDASAPVVAGSGRS